MKTTSKTSATVKPIRPAPKPSAAKKTPASKPALTTGQSMFKNKQDAAKAKAAGQTSAAPAAPKLTAGAVASKAALAEAKKRALANQPKDAAPSPAELEGATVTGYSLPAAAVKKAAAAADQAKPAAALPPAVKRPTVDGARQIAPRGVGIRLNSKTHLWRVRFNRGEWESVEYPTFDAAREYAVAVKAGAPHAK